MMNTYTSDLCIGIYYFHACMTVCVSVSTGVQQHFIFTMIIFIIVLDAVNSIVVLDISKRSYVLLFNSS